jgi:hypothetical protein
MTTITLTQYGRMAEKHWREFLPNLVAEMEAKGILPEMLLEAEEKTAGEMHELTMQFQREGLTAQMAHNRAWELIREKYILLTPENV